MPTSLCNECYQEVPADLRINERGVWLEKECKDHGKQVQQIEDSPAFYLNSLQKGPNAAQWYDYISSTALDVTERCNVHCPHCYALPDSKAADIGIEELVALSRKAVKGQSLILMGAEPTMRNDLGELCEALRQDSKKIVGIYTNAVRMADMKYVERHAEMVDFYCVSLHTRDYLDDPRLFDMKLKGIENIHATGKPIHHVSFSLPTLDHLDEAVDHAIKLKGIAQHIRIRTPSRIGICETDPIYLSHLVNRFSELMTERGIQAMNYHTDNNPYHINVLADEQLFRLIHYPSVHEIQLELLQTPPYALFVPELGETNIVHQFVFQAGLKEGKALKPKNNVIHFMR